MLRFPSRTYPPTPEWLQRSYSNTIMSNLPPDWAKVEFTWATIPLLLPRLWRSAQITSTTAASLTCGRVAREALSLLSVETTCRQLPYLGVGQTPNQTNSESKRWDSTRPQTCCQSLAGSDAPPIRTMASRSFWVVFQIAPRRLRFWIWAKTFVLGATRQIGKPSLATISRKQLMTHALMSKTQ